MLQTTTIDSSSVGGGGCCCSRRDVLGVNTLRTCGTPMAQDGRSFRSRVRLYDRTWLTTCAVAGYLPDEAPICRHDERLAVRRRLPVSCNRHSNQPYSTTATTRAADKQYSLVVLHTTLCNPNASAMPAYRKK